MMEIQKIVAVLWIVGIFLASTHSLSIGNWKIIESTNLNVSHYPTGKPFHLHNWMGERFLPKDVAFIDEAAPNGLAVPSSRQGSKMRLKGDGILGVDYFEMELKVILDSVLLQALESSGKDVSNYLQIFFHTVNHMYANSHDSDETFPTFKVKVVDVVGWTEEQESDIFRPVEGDNIMDIEKVLLYLKKKGKNGKFDKYDHVMLLTGRDLYRKVGGNYEPDVLGVAILNGTCTKSEDDKYKSLSVVEDVGGQFFGIYAAVHEIAHNLGVKHDSKTTSIYECNAKRGFIMSPVAERTANMFQFSECSLSSLKTFFFSKYGKCLAKGNMKPVYPADPTPGFPGDLYTMEQICKHLAEEKFANEVDVKSQVNPERDPSSLCKQISCVVRLAHRKYILEPPFAPGENMACGKAGGKCKSGECKHE